jgi:cell division septum initiation protein DivIVA
MDQSSAPDENQQATPIFSAYRRGYDPEQVDRYVAEQQRRLDEALARASEAERRLAAAVGQLRELHRRVAVLESEDRSPQTPALDTLGERVQRILQEAWEGAYALRQGAEQEVGELRAAAAAEAESIVEAARSKAKALEEATERRRQAFLEEMEQDRNRALAQIAYLHDQRRIALEELVKVRDVIEATVAKARFPSTSGDACEDQQAAASPEEVGELFAELDADGVVGVEKAAHDAGICGPDERSQVSEALEGERVGPAQARRSETLSQEHTSIHEELHPTMPVQHLGMVGDRREARRRSSARSGVFDFEAE